MTDDRDDIEEVEGFEEVADLPEGPVDYGQPTEISGTSKNWAVFAHLSTFSGLIGIPFGNVLGPLVFWLIKRNEDPYVERHAREALNFNIAVIIYGLGVFVVGLILLVVVIGLLVWIVGAIALFIFWGVVSIIAAVAASRGEDYDYPASIRFVSGG